MLLLSKGSVVPEHIQWAIIHKLVCILGGHEQIVLYDLVNIIVDAFTVAFVNGALAKFTFVQESAREPSRRKHS